MFFAGILVMAVAAGLLGSMLGVGGGIVVVPVLTLVFDVPIKEAIATSLVCVIATSTMAQLAFVARGLTNVRLGMFLEIATSVGALVGGITAVLVEPALLQIAFAAILFYIGYSMTRRPAEERVVRTGLFEAGYHDPGDGRPVVYGVGRPVLGFALSTVAGNVSGLLGIGGGAFKVPIMHLVMHVPLKATVATSNLMIGVTAATGAVIFYGRGFLDPSTAVPAAFGILIGAWLGPRLAVRLRSRTLARLFQALVLVFAVLMTLDAAGVA
jgi:uncharacterized membrane protein YfcA